MADATSELAKLHADRHTAEARVDDLERQHREAVQAARERSAELAEFERNGGTAKRRAELEQSLAAAKELAGQPWPERIGGAKSATRDADQAVRSYIAAHLGALIEVAEADGRRAAER